MAPYLVDFQMVLIELGPLAENELKGTEAGRLALALLKTVGEDRPMGWLRYSTILRDICRNFGPERLRRELRRALYYLVSVTDVNQEADVRRALQSVQDEFLPVKENIMTLLEQLEKRGEKRGERLGKVHTLSRQLSAVFPEFSTADADCVRSLPDEVLDRLSVAVAMHHSWAEIERILRYDAAE